MKVKVCGITSYEDAVLALDEEVDALGFNFFPSSPRYVPPDEVRSILSRIPPLAVAVGVFVNAPRQELRDAARASGVAVVQLHGAESPDYCRALDEWPLIKALRVGREGVAERVEDYPVRAFLLDSRDDKLFGGTGRTFDWSLAAGLQPVRPIILAGGLRADNVAEAIRTVRPYAVDVSSGVESRPGKKDARKLREFMDEVRNVSRNRP